MFKHTLQDDATGRSIATRVLFVHSTADEKVIRQQRQKPIDRITAEFTKLQQSVAAGGRNTDAAPVTQRAARALGTARAAKYFSWQLLPLTRAEIQKRPKPERGGRPPTHRFEFMLDAALLQSDEEHDGDNAIVTTVPKKQSSADQFFTRFKQQSDSEQVNSVFQGPLAVRPVFLHSPRRIEALMFLMVIALIHGEDRDAVLSPNWNPLQQLNNIKPLHHSIQEIALGSFRQKQPPAIKGSGWVVKSLEASLWVFHDAESFEDAVLKAVNLGDDADTTEAICGQLAGAFWGELNIVVAVGVGTNGFAGDGVGGNCL